MKKYALSLALGAMVLAAPAAAENWRTYSNDKYGYSFEAPTDWTVDAGSVDEYGLSLSSPDGTTAIKADGQFISPGGDDPLADVGLGDDADYVISRQRSGNSTFVAGSNGDYITYWKSVVSCGGTVLTNVKINLPKKFKSRYASIVQHIADSVDTVDPRGNRCGR